MDIFFNRFVNLQNGQTYLATVQQGIRTAPIVALHVVRELTGSVTLYNLKNEPFTFPNTAFVAGGIYNYPITKIEYQYTDDIGAIIGCKTALNDI